MTNLEKVLEVDGERFLLEIASKICFNKNSYQTYEEDPKLCSICSFYDKIRFRCDRKQIVEWLKNNVEVETK